MSLKIAITGIEGFVGSHLAELALKNKAEVFGTFYPTASKKNISHLKKIKLTALDIRDQKTVSNWVKKIKPDWVIHLAAQSDVFISPQLAEKTLSVNLLGTQTVLEASRLYAPQARLLIVGSANAYGKPPAGKSINETMPLKPSNPYAISKVCQEYLGEYYFQAYGLDVIRVRPFNHIGPRQAEVFVCSDIAKQIAAIELGKQQPEIRVGNIKVLRDFTDVRDIVKGYWQLMKRGRAGEVYNLCSGKAIGIEFVLKTLIQSSSKPIKIKTDPKKVRRAEIKEIKGSFNKIKKHTGWEPTISIKETLADILAYWQTEMKNV